MILCCGEALIDMIPEPTLSGREGFVAHAGGAVFNTAIALGRLGVDTGLLSGLSRDMFGSILRNALDAAHVDTSHVILSDRPTTLAFVRIEDGQASYSFFDENSAGRMLQPADLPALADRVSALYFGGISLSCEPGAQAYAALMAREGAANVTMLDPNIRPGFIADAGRYRARLDAMMSTTDILKVSGEDLDWMLPGPEPAEHKALVLLDKGPALVIVTFGGGGAMAFMRGGAEVQAKAHSVDVVDTVGAGDTFNAGVLAHLSGRGALSRAGIGSLSPDVVKDALAFGSQVAAVTVSRAGANPPWLHEL